MESTEVQEIELSIENARKMVKLAESLERLHDNPDFKDVITEGYFKDEAVRLVSLKAAPQMQDDHSQALIVKDIDGIGSLRQYFHTIYQMADNAQRAIEDGQAALDEMAEDGEL